MKKRSGLYPAVQTDAAGAGVVSHAGGVAPLETVRAAGLDVGLSELLAPWRKPTAVHDPAKVVLDLAVALALDGDCLADIAVLRAEPGVYGPVASDPTVSRTIDALATDAPRALAAINTARAAARARVWELAGKHAPDHQAGAQAPLIVDVDATLVTAHSDKEQARPTFKRGYGHHPLWAFADHGSDGTGEPLAVLLRPGNAGSNTAADHITVLRDALRQLPGGRPAGRAGRKVLVRVDGAGATHALLDWLVGQRLSYSVGFGLPANTADLLTKIPDDVWEVAVDAGRSGPRRGVGRRARRPARPDPLAQGDAGHRPEGTAAPRGRSCASPTSTGYGSRRSRPTAGAGNSPTSNYGTAGGPAARTGSGTPKTPAYGTCRCTTWSIGSAAPW